MFNLSLTACSFLLKKSYSQNKYYYLNDNISVENEDNVNIYNVTDMFIAFFDEFAHSVDNVDKKKTFHCIYEDTYHGETDDYHYLYTIIKSGSYGSSSDVVDNKTKKIVYELKPNHAPEKPFYLYVIIPKDNKKVKVQKGMFFFQNVGQFGVKTITTEYMREFFSDKFHTTLVCKTIASKLFVDRMLTKGNVSKIIMTKNHKSGDSSDNITKGYGVETRVIGNLAFSDNMWKKIKYQIDYFTKGKANLFEFDDIQYEGLKLNVNIGGRYRTINMNNIENLSLIEGIPDTIQDINGHAKEDLLLDYFKKIAEEYLKEMVLQLN
jgi:hypothetical protein